GLHALVENRRVHALRILWESVHEADRREVGVDVGAAGWAAGEVMIEGFGGQGAVEVVDQVLDEVAAGHATRSSSAHGIETKKPCTRSMPRSSTMANCSAVSTPSATTSRCRLRARSAIAATISRCSPDVAR